MENDVVTRQHEGERAFKETDTAELDTELNVDDESVEVMNPDPKVEIPED